MIIPLQTLKSILPQSYPFILIDQITAFEKDQTLTAIKNITHNEWIFENLSDGYLPQFPETLMIESAAQASWVLYYLSRVNNFQHVPKFILGKIQAEFSGGVFFSDQLEIKVLATKMWDKSGMVDAYLSVDKRPIGSVNFFYSVYAPQL